MSFFHNLNKTLDSIAARPESAPLNERDMGKHNNATTGFAALAKKAGGGEKGEKIAGAQFQKMKKAGQLEEEGMTPKQKSFAALAPPKDKITFADKIAGAKKEVDEMLGDVAADAMKSAMNRSKPESTLNQVRAGMQGSGPRANSALNQVRAGMQQRGAGMSAVNKIGNAARGRINQMATGQSDMDEASDDNAFTAHKRARAETPKVGTITHGSKHDVEEIPGGRRVTRRTDAQGISVGSDDGQSSSDAPRGRGRPKGPAKAPERVTGAATRHKGGRKMTKEAGGMMKHTFAILDDTLIDQIANMNGAEVDPDASSVETYDENTARQLIAFAQKNPQRLKRTQTMNTAGMRPMAQHSGGSGTGPEYNLKEAGSDYGQTQQIYDELADARAVAKQAQRGGEFPQGFASRLESVLYAAMTLIKNQQAGDAQVSEEELDDVDIADQGEYDQEGDMAKDSIKTVVRHAQALEKILGDNDNLPEWVQSKLAKIESMMTAVDDYMQNQETDQDDEMAMGEEKTSTRDSRAERAGKKVAKDIEYDEKKKDGIHGKKRGSEDNKADKAGKKVTKDIEHDEKEDDEKDDKPKKSKSKFKFGGSVYEQLDTKLETLINESMNISVNMATTDDGQQDSNSITVTASGEDAMTLAQLLKSAGLSQSSHGGCSVCGQSSCGCEQVDENSPDYPTNTETSNNAFQYSGGLNKPKSTGQTTTPVLASQLRRQVSMEESVKIERNLFDLYKNFAK